MKIRCTDGGRGFVSVRWVPAVAAWFLGGCGGASGADASLLFAADASVAEGEPAENADADMVDGTIEAAGADAQHDAGAPEEDARALDDAQCADDGAQPVPTPDAGPADACAATAGPPANYCAAVGALTSMPVIDGAVECGVPLWSMPTVVSIGAVPTSAQAEVAAAWLPGALYLYVRVGGVGASRLPAPPDSSGPWCGDAIELYVDDNGVYASPPMYDEPGTMQFIVGTPDGAGATGSLGYRFCDTDPLGFWNGSFVTVPTADGFALEALIVASDLGLASWSLAAGDHIGLDIGVDLGDARDDAGSCPRGGQFTIQLPDPNAPECLASCDVNEFCNPVLQ